MTGRNEALILLGRDKLGLSPKDRALDPEEVVNFLKKRPKRSPGGKKEAKAVVASERRRVKVTAREMIPPNKLSARVKTSLEGGVYGPEIWSGDGLLLRFVQYFPKDEDKKKLQKLAGALLEFQTNPLYTEAELLRQGEKIYGKGYRRRKVELVTVAALLLRQVRKREDENKRRDTSVGK